MRSWSAVRTCWTNQGFVTVSLSWSKKKGPASSPLARRYQVIAPTGHMSVPVLPTTTSAPTPDWSHLDCFRWIWIIRGDCRSSTATSPHARSVVAFHVDRDVGSSSPSLKNPKNAMVAPRDQSPMPLLKRVQAGISRIRLQAGKSAKQTRLPITFDILRQICTAWSRSSNHNCGLLCAVSGRPIAIWAFLTAAK